MLSARLIHDGFSLCDIVVGRGRWLMICRDRWILKTRLSLLAQSAYIYYVYVAGITTTKLKSTKDSLNVTKQLNVSDIEVRATA